MYFIRIYDTGIELFVCIQLMMNELAPFVVASITLLFALSKIYKVLHMGINDPDQLYKQINSPILEQLM